MTIDSLIININNVHEKSPFYKWVMVNLDAETEITVMGKRTKMVRARRDEKDSYFANGGFIYKSSGYNITWNFNANLQRIVLNFSIPKAVFGTNVLMYKAGDIFMKFSRFDEDISEEYFNRVFLILHSILREMSFGALKKIHWEAISLSRIDLCRNYVFPSKLERDLFYTAIENKKRKNVGLHKRTDFKDETLYWTHQDYTLKWYKKDIEFKSSKKKGKKSDMRLFCETYPVELAQDILELAEKTLRFEIGFRNSQVSKYFQKYIEEIYHEDDVYNKAYFFKFHTMETEFHHANKTRVFDYSVLDLLNWKAEEYVKDFAITSLPTNAQFEENIIKAKILYPKMAMNRYRFIYSILADSEKNETIDTLVDKGIISRATRYNLIPMFKRLGIDIVSVQKRITKLPDDYSQYYKHIKDSRNILNHIQKSIEHHG